MRRWVDRAPLLARIGLLVAVGLPGLFIILAYLGLQVIRTTTDDIVQHRTVIAEMMAGSIDGELRAHLRALQLEAGELAPSLAAGLADGERARTSQALRRLRSALGESAVRVALLDREGRVLLGEPAADAARPALDPDDATVREALDTGRAAVSPARAEGGLPLVTLAVPVRRADGPALGALACVLDSSRLGFTHFARDVRKLGVTGHAELVDQRGVVLAASEPERLLQPAEHPELYRGQPVDLTAAVATTAGADGAGEAWRSQPHDMVLVPLQAAPWSLSLGATESETMAPVRRLERDFLVLIVAGLGVNLLLLILTASRVVTPLRTLIGAAERISRGDLGAAVPPVGVAEVKALADAFERMRCQLWTSQRDLAVEKSRYEGIFKAIADPVFTVDTELRVTSMNPAAERFLGWNRAESIGRRCTELLQPCDEKGRSVCALVCPLVVKSRAAVLPAGCRESIETSSGKVLTIETTRSPIRDEAGRIVGIVHVLRDVSAEVEANRLKDQFVASVSHELRTPLGYIKGFTTTLMRRDAQWSAEKARHFLEMIDYSTDRLAEQIDNLLEMSRISAGELSIEPQPVELPSLVRSVVERVQPRAERHSFAFAWPAILPPAAGDARRIEQVLFNLLDNALKYSPAGGEIRVEVVLEGRHLRVQIADEGIGVPAAELEAIFGRFYRAEDAAVQRIRGSGLGLAICRGIVEAHGGAIWAERRPGRGSLFCFTLPVWAGAGPPSLGAPSPVAEHVGGQAEC